MVIRNFVNYKLTVIMHRFSFLLSNVLLDHLIRDGSGADGQVPSGPKVPAPELLPEMRKFLKEHPRTRPLQPLHYFAEVLMGMIGDKNVNIVA